VVVRHATIADVQGWRALAREVEPLFGPMVGRRDFEDWLVRDIDRGTAWCVPDPGDPGSLAAAMSFRDRGDRFEIGWLAVAARARRTGVGTGLVRERIGASDPAKRVTVVTFGADHPGGPVARAFYERLGFEAGDPAPDGPDGGARQTFVLPPRAL
jgi:GNAT superfamily N-acetyltransferase